MFTGEQLRLLRQTRKMKQEEVALKLGIKQQRYSVLENSTRVSKEKQDLILGVLNYSEDEAKKILGLIAQPQ